ncbi:MAG: DUF4990 domain-containing protein [Prevotella sp.]|nr:DUF4990 domain-containing protein [Prevotella sp.]
MKRIAFLIVSAAMAFAAHARDFYVAPDGSDAASGSVTAPFATLKKAIERASAGDVIYLRGGTYKPSEQEIMGYQEGDLYACVYNLTKSGTAEKPLTIAGYAGERAVIDLSGIRPEGKRVSGFYVKGSYWRLRDFDIVGIQVTITGHTQSENISMRGGSNCIIERVNIHDGMGIGIYFTRGSNNLVLNCDAYNNYDPVSENGKGGNCDGFGFHLNKASYTGNVIRGCRAWRNSDDGIDLISNLAPVVVDSCWAWENGYDAGRVSRGDGTGIKAGGYGMGTMKGDVDAPRNVIKNCICWANKANGFYSNHHLGGNDWHSNSAYQNKYNFYMVNRKAWDEAVDVDGYGHVLTENLSYKGRKGDYGTIDEALCTLSNNTFLPTVALRDADFESLDGSQLLRDRKADGSLPDISFLRLKPSAEAYGRQIGWQFDHETVTTGIAAPAVSPGKAAAGRSFDLRGLPAEPDGKGIRISRGRKVIVR